jgi:hypothetical protein
MMRSNIPQQKKQAAPDPQVEEVQRMLLKLGYSGDKTVPPAWSRKIKAEITAVEFNEK